MDNLQVFRRLCLNGFGDSVCRRQYGVGRQLRRNNAVKVPSYTRLDSAVFYDFNEHWSAQFNIENTFDTEYWISSHTPSAGALPASSGVASGPPLRFLSRCRPSILTASRIGHAVASRSRK